MVPPPTVIDCDRLSKSAPRSICDFLVFCSRPEFTVAVVEMKGRVVDARKSVEQLQAGAAVVDEIAPSHTISDFLPILLSQAVKHASVLKVLKNTKIRFRGRSYRVLHGRCGARLTDFIRPLGNG